MEYFESALINTRDSNSYFLYSVYFVSYWIGALVAIHVSILTLIFFYRHVFLARPDLL